MRTFFRQLVLGVGLTLAAACERGGKATPSDSATRASATPPPADTSADAMLGWDATSAGAVMLVNSGGGRDAAVVFPQFTDSTLTDSTTFDLGALREAPVELFARGGKVAAARLSAAGGPRRSGDECISWPSATVSAPAGATAAAWAVGFLAGHATALPIDSIERMSRADSAAVVAEVARLASMLPSDTAPAFRGLPYAARSVRFLRLGGGVTAMIAEVVRKLNQEANPREEHLLLVAERSGAGLVGRYATAYFERGSDTEDAIVTTDVLAAVALGPTHIPTLVLSREYNEGGEYALLERAPVYGWRLRWTSAYTGC
jgi:hypothetical protein